MRAVMLMGAVGALALLAACGEKPQTLGGVRGDVAPFQGVSSQYAAPGWKAGDKTSWEQGLKARAQYSQNEYSRTAATK
jgi:hypothetical protein